jgi:hypothetical protein
VLSELKQLLVNVRLLTSQGCTPCLRVKHILKELQTLIPSLVVEEIDFTSSAGSILAIETGVLYPPAVFLEDMLIAKGKIDAETLTANIRAASWAH